MGSRILGRVLIARLTAGISIMGEFERLVSSFVVVHPLVCQIDEFIEIVRLVGVDSTTNGTTHVCDLVGKHVGRFDQLSDFLGDTLSVFSLADAGEDHCKFIATDPGHHVGLTDALKKTFTNQCQHVIAAAMTKLIVDWFKTIQVNVENRKTGLGLVCLGPRAGECFQEQIPVGQVGDLVIVRAVRQFQVTVVIHHDQVGQTPDRQDGDDQMQRPDHANLVEQLWLLIHYQLQ